MEFVDTQISHEDDSIGTLLRLALAREVSSFGENVSIATLRTDPDGLHDARVAIRRMRSYLRTFRNMFEPSWASGIRADLSWYGTLLGAVRNVDVIAIRLGLRDEETLHLEESAILRDVISARWTACFDELVEAGESRRYAALRKYLDMLGHYPPLRPTSHVSARSALPVLLERPWRDVREAARSARMARTEANLHALRIRAKELRYASELASKTFGKRAMRLASSAAAIQDRLGSHRDALACVALLDEVGYDYASIYAAMSQLAAREQLAARNELVGLPDDLRMLKKRWKIFRQFARN
jgi:CHAD domain-containing protein